MNLFKKKIRDIKLTLAWLSTKDMEDGNKYTNLRSTANKVSKNLRSIEAISKITTTTLMAGMLGSALALKNTYWNNYLDNIFDGIPNKPQEISHEEKDKTDTDIIINAFNKFNNNFIPKIKEAHEEAPYKKYAAISVVGFNSALLISMFANTARKRRELENKPPSP